MTLLRELIDIPTSVGKGDFVISLTRGVEERQATVDSYVVTPQLAGAFDEALGFIAGATSDGKSKATYLDGSFGSGKSHFMAILDLVLQRDPLARGLAELHPVISKHKDLDNLSFSVVPLSMIGAETLEQGIFSRYIDHVREHDPEGPLPALYTDHHLIEEADRRRAELGDEEFFRRLNRGEGTAQEGWGDLAGGWTLTTYADAKAAALGDPRRSRLQSSILVGLLPVFADAMRGSSAGYINFDLGLAEMARHAQGRGHDALVLFLDELVLWLGSRMADMAFVQREGSKLAQLIEFTAARPIPIISFVARQRDLREFVGSEALGAQAESFADTLAWWDGRFHHLELEDRNLHAIAQHRILRPRDEAARQELDAAFRETERVRPEVLDVLLTGEGNREAFRKTYPFSPAFMDALVAASGALQRERTALRVMLQLLVDRRDDLEVGDLVGVGDLYDVLAVGDEPFSDDMRARFGQAKDLYERALRPMLLHQHGLTDEAARAGGRGSPFASDDRLVKTLLLAALLPATASLRELDAFKLTALNHGTITSPIPGEETGLVVQKLRRWAAEAGALRLGEDPANPAVALRLTGIDLDTIIDRAKANDNAGVRRQLVRTLVLGELGVSDDRRLFSEHPIEWRGTARTVQVVFGNIRDPQDVPDDTLRADGDGWKVVVDYPFDPGHSPDDDLDRLDRWRAERPASRTVCWVPAFFAQPIQSALGRLAIVRHVLGGERLEQYADHLSQQDRQQARGLLADHASALEQRLKTAIRQAYGVEPSGPDSVDPSHPVENRLQSLQPGFSPQIPVGAQLADAFSGLATQMLDAQYPDHPRFEAAVRPRDLRVVLDEVRRAAEASDGRIEVPSDRRRVMRTIAAPLGLGTQHEAPFVLSARWKDHFDRAINQATAAGDGDVTVERMRRWIDEPRPLGLPADVQSLLILAYAAMSGRAFSQRGGPAPEVDVNSLPNDLELVLPVLPPEEPWRVAAQRASSILGIAAVNPARTPSSVAQLVAKVRSIGQERLGPAENLVPLLNERLAEVGAAEGAPRVSSALAAMEIAQGGAISVEDVKVIERLAGVQIPTTEQAVGTSLASAAEVIQSLSGDRWTVLGVAAERARAGEPAFARIVTELRAALERDEFQAPIEPAVARAYADAVALLAPPPPPPPPTGGTLVDASIADARAKLDELAGENGAVRVSLTWSLEAPSE